LAATTAPLVAFVDSDAEVSAKTLGRLAVLFDDPAVAAAAPRIHPAGSRLDMGERAAVARPGARTSYVPSTVLVVRRSAIEAIGGFDEQLRVGEDVDLVWRLAAAGWTVRYVPEFPAAHHELNWLARLRRSARYGTATGPLARRHPGAGTTALSPPVLPVAAVLLACLGRPRLAAAALTAAAAGPARRLHAAGVPAPQSTSVATTAALTSAAHSARWVAQIWSPALVAATWRAYHRRDRSAGLALATAALGPTRLIDDIAYGTGVWTGCLRTRSFWPLVPRLGRR
jgi:hypothetical protein